MGGLLGMMLAASPGSPVRRLVMNDVGAYLPMDALQAIGRNLQAPERFASLAEVEAHLRHTHREWGALTGAQWAHLARHHARRTDDGYRLHYDPRIARLVQSHPLVPGLFFWDAWYKVRCPVLLVRGEHSRIFPASVAKTMLDIKPDARLVEIAGAGHAPSLMSADEHRIVSRFLASEGALRAPARPSASRAARRRFQPLDGPSAAGTA